MVVVVGACAPNRGHVEVNVFDQLIGGGGGPIQGAVIAFRDRDGSSRSATTDASGHAEGDVEAGGSVWCSPSGDLLARGTNVLLAFEEVQPGAVLHFGAPAVTRAAIATVHVTAVAPRSPPQGVTRVEIFTSCTRSMNPTTGDIDLDDRCSGAVDILAVVRTNEFSSETWGPYFYLPGQPIVDGGTIAVPTTGWLPLDTVSVQLANLDGATAGGSLENAFGFRGVSAGPGGSVDRVTSLLPDVGPLLRVRASVGTDTAHQEIEAVVARATPTLDVHAVAAPYVTQSGLQTLTPTWSFDDHGGALRADVMVTRYQWSDDTACQEGVTATVIGPPRPTGRLPQIALPGPFACAQPRDSFVVTERVGLARFEGAPMADPEQAMALYPLTTVSQAGDSIAVSEF